ncbi:MAG: hypothetical protein HGB26_00170 [Desulfobulbaceae bacterium]|nr:hypothetical protein [Desulfobulbaceae bacterium]
MTALLATAFFFVPLTFGCAALVAQGRERFFLWRAIGLAWAMLLPILYIINEKYPFSGGGDDWNYYLLATRTVHSFSDLLSLTRFKGLMEQPGFPWLLSILNYFSGQDLMTFKLLNLTLLILLAIVWYRMGVLLESPGFGRVAAIGILLLTPIWYYMFFLLKDMVITLIQSLFLLGLVAQWRKNSIRYWLLIGVSILIVALFRSPLVPQSLAVLGATLMMRFRVHNRSERKIMIQIIGWGTVLGFIIIATSPDVMASLGIYTQHRIIGTAMVESVSRAHEASLMNRTLFPLLYLFSETSGLSEQAWIKLDPGWLRGLLALPWIFFVVPFSLLGIFWLARAHSTLLDGNFGGRLRRSKLIGTPWVVLILFILSYMAISWTVGDTTRWRIPDMPVLCTLAVAGWYFPAARIRHYVLFFWTAGSGTLFSLFYLITGN